MDLRMRRKEMKHPIPKEGTTMKRIQRKMVLAVMVMLLGLGVAGAANAATITLTQNLNDWLLGVGDSKTFSFLVDQFTVPPAIVTSTASEAVR